MLLPTNVICDFLIIKGGSVHLCLTLQCLERDNDDDIYHPWGLNCPLHYEAYPVAGGNPGACICMSAKLGA